MRKSLCYLRGLACFGRNTQSAQLCVPGEGTQIPDDVKKQLGRWRPSPDEGYERNVRINVLRSQRIIAEFVKVNKGRENPLDGDSVLRRVGDVMLRTWRRHADPR